MHTHTNEVEDMSLRNKSIEETLKIFQEYLRSEKAQSLLKHMKKEKREVKELMKRLSKMDVNSPEFTEWVLYGLLPYGKSRLAKRVSTFPAFLNIKKFFRRYNYSEEEWNNVAQAIYTLASNFQKKPQNLEGIIREFKNNKYSVGFQCGSISPILFGINDSFPLVNGPVTRGFNHISTLLGRKTKLHRRLNEYPENIRKLKDFVEELRLDLLQKHEYLDLFFFWYDSEVLYKGRKRRKKSQRKIFEFLEEVRPVKVDLSDFIEAVDLQSPSKFAPHILRNPERIKIIQIMSDCSSTRWVLPHFQRYFDWKKEDITDFLKSIFNDYYVGAFLLWDAGGEPEVKVQPIKGAESGADLKAHSVILDGQQRITSLFYAILGPKLSGFEDKSNWRDTRIYREHPLYFFADFGTFLRDPKSPYVIKVYRRRIKNEDCFKSLLFPFYELDRYDDWVSEFEKFLRNYSSNQAKIYDIKEIIRKKLAHIWAGYEIPYISLPKEMRIHEVTEIFEQLNTKGKPLSVFDLLIARLFKYDIKLKDLWDATAKKHPSIFRYSKRIEKTPIYILQAISLSYDKNSSAKRSDILDIYKNIYEDNESWTFEKHWFELSEYLNSALEKLENLRDGFGVKDEKEVPFTPMIPVLAALLRTIESQDNKADCYQKLDKWYWSSVFTNAYSAAADSQMTADFKDMKEWFEDSSKMPKTVRNMISNFPKLSFREIQSKWNSKYRGVMSLIALEGAQDFDTSQVLENARENDKDHIFPRSRKLGFGLDKSIHSVLNMTWMSKDTNRNIKQFKKPSAYLPDFISKKYGGDENKFIEILKTHLISKPAYGFLLKDDIASFMEEREQIILSKIRKRLEIEDIARESTLISPETPFTNKKIFWDTLRSCEGYIHWIDKYFSKAGLELIAESSLNPRKIREIKVLMSAEKVNEKFRKLFKDLRDELKNKGITIEIRAIIDSRIRSEIHDRWIISQNRIFNVTSPDIMARGQYSEIKETTNKPPFTDWWKKSKDIIREWSETERATQQ